jgi:hypothetical protein
MHSLILMGLSTGDTLTAILISLATPIRSTMVTTATVILTTMAMAVDMEATRTVTTVAIHMWCMQALDRDRTRQGTQAIAVLDTHEMADM